MPIIGVSGYALPIIRMLRGAGGSGGSDELVDAAGKPTRTNMSGILFSSIHFIISFLTFNHPLTAEAKRQAKKERRASKGRIIRG